MRPAWVGVLAALGGAVVARADPPTELAAVPPTDLAAALVAEAGRVLADPGDTAVIVELPTGRVLLEHHPRVARQSRMAPGSAMKPFTAYALLEAGLEQHAYTCPGHYTDPHGVKRTCWDRRGHGPMRLRTAIADSCNVWFYEAASHVEADAVLAAWRKFGLPAARVDGVSADEIPRHVDEADLPDIAVGDSRVLGITPRSLLAATVRLATRDASTGLDRGALEVIANGLEEAAQSGTLAGTFTGLDVAAKSGTAARPGGGMRGLVIGWAPALRPRFAWVVVKDRGRGARDAGPPARALVALLPRGAP